MNRLMSNAGDILPASEGMLIYFASYLARTVEHSTIKLSLSVSLSKLSLSDPVISPSPVFAVTAMRNSFLADRSRRPLSSFQSGRLLTRAIVVNLLRDAAGQVGRPPLQVSQRAQFSHRCGFYHSCCEPGRLAN